MTWAATIMVLLAAFVFVYEFITVRKARAVYGRKEEQ